MHRHAVLSFLPCDNDLHEGMDAGSRVHDPSGPQESGWDIQGDSYLIAGSRSGASSQCWIGQRRRSVENPLASGQGYGEGGIMRAKVIPPQFLRTVGLIVCGLFSCGVCFGQVGTASLQGTVTDSTGGVMAGVTVTVTNVQTGVTRTLKTDSQGRYTAPELQIGEYEVQAQMSGFQTGKRTGVTLAVGDQRVLDFTLAVGQASEVVEVKGGVPQVETTTSTISSLIDQKQMSDLPLNGRNFAQLIQLAPGVQSVPAGAGGTFYGTNGEYSISGQRPVGQALILDGAPIQNFWGHGTGSSAIGTSLGVDAIAEFQIFTNTYGAQFGGNGGGINAVTKSGTNGWHGSAYEFLRESTFDARNYFDPLTGPPSFHRNQFGGTLGGPIKKDKLFFFINFEGLRQDLGQTVISSVPDAAARAEVTNPVVLAMLDPSVTPLPNFGDDPATGIGGYRAVATQAAQENYLTARLDYSLSPSDTIFARYILDRSTLVNPFGAGPFGNYPEHDLNRNQFLTLAERKLVSNSLLNNAQFNFTRTIASGNAPNRIPAFDFVPANPLDGGASVPGIATLGEGFSVFPFNFVQNKFEGQDEIFWTHNRHSIMAGISVGRVQSTTLGDIFAGGLFIFASYGFNPGGVPQPGSFLSGEPFLFTGAGSGQAEGTRSFRETQLTGYVQDDWKVNSRVTVNLGLRYEFVTNPVEVNGKLNAIVNVLTDTGFTHVSNVFASNLSLHNLDPRVGLAWSLTNDQKTVLRAGFGVFHAVVGPRDYFAAYSLAPPFNTLTIVEPAFSNPFTFTGLFSVPTPNISQAADYNSHHTPYVMQYNLNVQRDLGAGIIATLAYVGSKGVHLWQQGEANPPTLSPGSTPQNPVFTDPLGNTNPRLNQNFGTVDLVRPRAYSSYHALQASLNKRFSHGLDVQAYYTWSKCIDDSSSSYALEYDTGLQQNPYNLSQDRSLCAFNAAQNFSGTVLYELPFHGNKFAEGWEISNIVTANSGHPFTVFVGFDSAGLGETVNLVDRPNLVPGRSLGSITTHNPNQWFDPAAFTLPAAGTLGNEPRNALIGPRLVTDDFALIKNTRFGEKLNVEFRAEAFNIFNHPNFAPPGLFGAGGGIGSGIFTGGFNPDGTPIRDPNAGRITSTSTTSRQLQFALKFIF